MTCDVTRTGQHVTRTAPAPRRAHAIPLRTVRWQLLFSDLESEFATARAQEALAGVPDLVRAERAATHLADRVRASVGLPLRLEVGEGPEAVLGGVLADAGPDWLLLSEPASRQVLVPLAAVLAVSGLAPHVAPEEGPVRARLGLPHALRALARDRAEVRVSTAARTLVGRLDRVGADYVDVTPVAGPTWPWTVPVAALRAVRSR